MITDGILALFYGLISPVVAVIPSGTFPLDTNGNEPGGLSRYLWQIDYVVPVIDPVVWVLTVAGSTAAALIAYRVGLFIYGLIRGGK